MSNSDQANKRYSVALGWAYSGITLHCEAIEAALLAAAGQLRTVALITNPKSGKEAESLYQTTVDLIKWHSDKRKTVLFEAVKLKEAELGREAPDLDTRSQIR